MNKVLTLKDFARMGGKARWRGIDKKRRSEAMKRVRSATIHKQAPQTLDEQAQAYILEREIERK